jgi:chemotaxis protein CheZ
MPVRQKTFRIEKVTAGGEPRSVVAPGGAISVLQHHEVLNELRALREMIEQRPPAAPQGAGSESENALKDLQNDQITVGDLNKLKSETDSIHRAISHTMREVASLHFGGLDVERGRASRELDAVVDSTERATQQILDAAESIDEAADMLSAALKQDQEQALTSDIRDHVVRIFEACNFQDLSGQRIAKVLATLTFVEDRVARMLEIWGGRAAVENYAAATQDERNTEAKLVSGPKLDGDSGHVSQQEIDAMFA